MELYKWYKGDELPDRECDCVILYGVPVSLAKRFNIDREPVKEITRWTTSVYEGEDYIFVDRDGDPIPNTMIIAWMPIEFPEEVS